MCESFYHGMKWKISIVTEIAAQATFNSGEWAPSLFARVDLQKYRSGAALLENFFIDYRGGASTRMGTKYILQAYNSAFPVRIIGFQPGFTVGYILEFGQNYLRFYFQGSPILEDTFPITDITQANPAGVTVTGNPYAANDWIFITGVVGMTQVNDRYFQVLASGGGGVTLADLNGVPIDSTAYTAYVSGGTAQRVYTLQTPYAATDLALLKFAGNLNQLILTHPSYPPAVLTLVTATNWTLTNISFGSTALPPTGVTITTTLGTGSVNYAYGVTSLDSAGQESELSAVGALANKLDIRSVAGSNQIAWTASANAVAYNVYESSVSYFGVVPAGVSFGFIGTCKGVDFIDSNIGPDFSQAPPIAENPFVGGGVASVTVTAPGAYTTVPTVIMSGGSPVIPATLAASLSVTAATIGTPGSGYVVGDIVNYLNGVSVKVLTVFGGSSVATIAIVSSGSVTAGTAPSVENPTSTSGVGVGLQLNLTWGVSSVAVISPGAGDFTGATVAFSSGAATATATLLPALSGAPSVPSFCQQRLVLAAPPTAPQTFYMSQPGSYFNFNTSNPVEADDTITETIVSTTQQTIKSIISATSGMVVLTDKAVWLVNGGSSGSAITPTNAVVNPQSFVGASDVPPIQANWSILHVAAKGASVRELAYNIYFNVFTGSDISITSSHLFFGFEITEWAWAESPFYVAWAVRNDGVMLTLTFLKEQEFIGWTHQTTQGLFKSVATVTEATSDAGNVDAVYVVAQRSINGNTVQYIERIADRVFPNGLSSAWCVDSGVQYVGTPGLSFTGAEHLAGAVVTGLATDDLGNVTVITAFVMPVNGEFTLPAPTPPGSTGYTTVTVGLGFTAQLQTLAIDISRMQIQGEVKKIPYVDVRVNETLGLWIGADSSDIVPMKDLILGNVSSMLTGQPSQVVTGLVSGDARTILTSTYTVPGQYYIQQPYPYPATILGVFPALVTESSP